MVREGGYFSLLAVDPESSLACRQTANVLDHRPLEEVDRVRVRNLKELLRIDMRLAEIGSRIVYVADGDVMKNVIEEIDTIGRNMEWLPGLSKRRFYAEEVFAKPCSIVTVKFNTSCSAVSYTWWNEHQSSDD